MNKTYVLIKLSEFSVNCRHLTAKATFSSMNKSGQVVTKLQESIRKFNNAVDGQVITIKIIEA